MAFTVATKLGSSVNESFTITDGTVNSTSTPLSIIGHAAPPGYAYSAAKTLVDILSNYASAPSDRPSKPLIGMNWFDYSAKSLYVYTGSSGGWKAVYTDGATNMMIPPAQGGLGIVPTSAVAGYVVKVNSSGTGYEYSPGAFVRTDASSSPNVTNSFDIGSATATYKNIFSTNFIGNASTTSKLQTPRTIKLSGHLSGTIAFDGSSDVEMTTQLVGGTLSQYIQRTGDSMSLIALLLVQLVQTVVLYSQIMHMVELVMLLV
jgi:hypothetical protein